jgi:hypothetical protein
MSAVQYAVVGYPSSYNLGDEIQSIAAAKLLPRVDRYLPREGLDAYQSAEEHLRLLCNGFFLHEPQHWPPGAAIDPLFISFHVSTETGADQYLLRPELKQYYQKYAPIGCRDRGTARRFTDLGVEAYFSGCVTLTLQNPYTEAERTNEIVLADPFYKFQSEDYRRYLRKAIVPPEHRARVVEVTHALDKKRTYGEQEKVGMAENLLDRYAKASLVITSRIHVALPCLGLGTPVLFINMGYDRNSFDRERFDGLLELFHTIEADHFPLSSRKPLFKLARLLRLHRLRRVAPLNIDFEHPPANKSAHLALTKDIRTRVQQWVSKCSPR